MPIYKYVVPERIDIIKNSLIRFTQPSAFNDPFECLPFIQSLTSEDVFNDQKHQWDDSFMEKSFMKAWNNQRCKYNNIQPFEKIRHILIPLIKASRPEFEKFMTRAMTTRDYPSVIFNNMIMGEIDKSIGILSLTETKNNLLMWSHYAFNHTGFLIEFDEKHPFFDQRKNEKELRRFLKKVTYSLKRPSVFILDPKALDQNGSKNNFDKWVNNFFFTKSEHWNYEKEWRMIESLPECKNILHAKPHKIYLFPVPKNCIRGLIFGCRISSDTKQKLTKIISRDSEYSHLKIQQAEMDEQEYRLNFKMI